MLVLGQEVELGSREDIVVFWTDGDERRAIVALGYASVHAAVERVLRKYPGGATYYDNLRGKVGDLSEPGAVIQVVIGVHRVGLLHPYLLDGIGDQPYVVCRGPVQQPTQPVLCGSWEAAQGFAKRASQDEGLSREGWCAFRGERMRAPIDQLFVRAHDGRALLRSELEEAVNESLQREREGRRTVTARQGKPKHRSAKRANGDRRSTQKSR
jgi:hypothetical protein